MACRALSVSGRKEVNEMNEVDQQAKPENDIFGEVIFAYTRRQAIEDGVLVDVTKEAKEAGYVFGGTSMTVLRKITVPMLKPTITTAVLLRLIAAIQI